MFYASCCVMPSQDPPPKRSITTTIIIIVIIVVLVVLLPLMLSVRSFVRFIANNTDPHHLITPVAETFQNNALVLRPRRPPFPRVNPVYPVVFNELGWVWFYDDSGGSSLRGKLAPGFCVCVCVEISSSETGERAPSGSFASN